MTEEALNNNAALIWPVAGILRNDSTERKCDKAALPSKVLGRSGMRRLKAEVRTGRCTH